MDDKHTIIEVLKSYERCVNHSDAVGLGALYEDKAILYPDRMDTFENAENITGFYQYAFSILTLNLSFSISEKDIFVEGNTGYATTHSTGTRYLKESQQTVPEINRELWVFKKVSGVWKISRYCFNKTE